MLYPEPLQTTTHFRTRTARYNRTLQADVSSRLRCATTWAHLLDATANSPGLTQLTQPMLLFPVCESTIRVGPNPRRRRRALIRPSIATLLYHSVQSCRYVINYAMTSYFLGSAWIPTRPEERAPTASHHGADRTICVANSHCRSARQDDSMRLLGSNTVARRFRLISAPNYCDGCCACWFRSVSPV